jgi:hypothetical protein
LDIAVLPIGLYAGLFLLIVGLLAKYGIKWNQIELGFLLQLIIYSCIVGNGLVLMVKGFIFSVSGTSILGIMSSSDEKALMCIGALCGAVIIVALFIKFISHKKPDEKEK